MKPNPICWFEIYVENMERAKKFYETVFQVKLAPIDDENLEMWSFPMDMDHAGAPGTLVKKEGVSAGGNGTLVYFSCEDCATEAARVVTAGGQLEKGKFSIGQYGFIALAVDTEGNRIGLHSME